MTLKLVRVDDRLIHGQVVAVWLRAVGAHRIVIVDDRTAQDEFLRDLVVLAAPQGVQVEVHSVADGAARVMDLADTSEDVFVLLRSPVIALGLRRAGVPFDVLNVGGMGSGPGRRSLYKNISANEDELAAMRELEKMGTRVELRIVADDRAVPFSSVDKSA
ncbi:MAG: PTS sugar transporter subunit IIB [Chloroflexi bacterium]|nr:PTS sugar transporter subunit IIB [Chloroflexota bacterium]